MSLGESGEDGKGREDCVVCSAFAGWALGAGGVWVVGKFVSFGKKLKNLDSLLILLPIARISRLVCLTSEIVMRRAISDYDMMSKLEQELTLPKYNPTEY